MTCYYTEINPPSNKNIPKLQACYASLFKDDGSNYHNDKLLNGEKPFNKCYCFIKDSSKLSNDLKINWFNYLKSVFGGIVSIHEDVIKYSYYGYTKSFNGIVVEVDPYKLKYISKFNYKGRYLIYKILLTLIRYSYENEQPNIIKYILENYDVRDEYLKNLSILDILINFYKHYNGSNSNHDIVSYYYIDKLKTNYIKTYFHSLSVKSPIMDRITSNTNRPHIFKSIDKYSTIINNKNVINSLQEFYNEIVLYI